MKGIKKKHSNLAELQANDAGLKIKLLVLDHETVLISE
jgi:hypothetical protein